jgi:DNA-binding NarL/FixJ family response regulator
MIRIFIADDHQMFVDGIKRILAEQENMTLVGEAANGRELLNLLPHYPCDVLLLDINMPEYNGLEVLEKLHELAPECRVLMLSMYDEGEVIIKALKKGAHGYLLKNASQEELIEAIEELSRGKKYYSDAIGKKVMEGLMEPALPKKDLLSEREKEVMCWIVEEYTTDQIAEKLCISHHTVESHRKNILSKIGAKNTAGIVRYALAHGITLS